jgi:hypothetical protein
MAGGRLAAEWWQQAAFTYPVCGLLAGLLSAAVWFRLRSGRPEPATDDNEALTPAQRRL